MAKQKIKVIREEMLQVANNVAQEKSIDKDSVFEAMEQALEKAARVKYGFERDIRVNINRDTGDIKLNSYLKVVETLDEEEQAKQIKIEEAKKALKFTEALIGINNRNLKTLKTDLNNTFEIYKTLNNFDGIFISESGIKNKDDVLKISNQTNIKTFLIGESLLKNLDNNSIFSIL